MRQKSTSPRFTSNTTCNPCVPQKAMMMMDSEKMKGLVCEAVQEILPAYFFDQVQCLTTDQVAELTGMKKETVGDWIRTGKLMASKPGKDYIITVADLKAFLKDTKVKAPVISMQQQFKKRKAI